MTNRFAELNTNLDELTQKKQGLNTTLASNVVLGEETAVTVSTPQTREDLYREWLEQPSVIASFTWVPATTGSTNITFDLYDTLQANNSSLMKKLANFRFIEASIRLKVIVQGCSYAQGSLVIAASPYVVGYETIVKSFSPGLVRALLLPHIVVDPSKSQFYELVLPCPTQWGFFKNGDTASGSWEVDYFVLNPLGSGTTATPSVNIQVLASFESPKPFVPTYTSAAGKERGPISGLLYGASDFSSKFSNVPIPVISESTTLFSAATKSIADFLAWFGFSKPLKPSDMVVAVNGNSMQDTQLDSIFTGTSLSGRVSNSIGLQSSPMCNMEDQIIANLASREGLVYVGKCTTAQAASSLCFKIPIDPSFCYSDTDSQYEMTPLAFVTRPYKYWRGDIKVRVEFVCSAFHRATMCFAYLPNAADNAATYVQVKNNVKTWDVQISGNTSMEFVIPWSQLRGFETVGRLQPITAAGVYTGTGNNGYLNCYCLNPLSTGGSTDPLWMNVYFSCSDIRMGYPDMTNVLSLTPNWTSASNLTPAPVGVGFSNDDVSLYAKYFGESPARTIKELGSRMTLGYVLTDSGRTGTGSIAWKLINQIPNGYTTDATGVVSKISLISFLSWAYLGYVGSLNYKWYPDINQNELGVDSWTYASVTLDDSLAVGFIDSASVNAGRLDGNTGKAFFTAFGKLSNFLNFTVPYYYRNGMYKFTWPFASTDGFLLGLTTKQPIATPFSGRVYVGLGDDAQFVYFVGCQRVTQS